MPGTVFSTPVAIIHTLLRDRWMNRKSDEHFLFCYSLLLLCALAISEFIEQMKQRMMGFSAIYVYSHQKRGLKDNKYDLWT
jgi:hypothetical protein